MKVMKLVMEVDDFDKLLPIDDDLATPELLGFDGEKKFEIWPETLEMYRYDLTNPIPDLVDCGSGTFGVWRRSLEVLQLLLRDYELLPFTSPFGDGFMVNVISFVDCFDETKAKWEDEDKIFVSEYAFKEKCVPTSLVFKVPQDPITVFCTDEIHNPNSLYAIARRENLTGARFEVVWEG